jgi:hypothetical protein
MSRLNPQGHCRVQISIVEQHCQATKKRKPCGGSKFNVQEFKVNFHLAEFETNALTNTEARSNRSSRSTAILRLTSQCSGQVLCSKRFGLRQVPSVPKFQLFQSLNNWEQNHSCSKPKISKRQRP